MNSIGQEVCLSAALGVAYAAAETLFVVLVPWMLHRDDSLSSIRVMSLVPYLVYPCVFLCVTVVALRAYRWFAPQRPVLLRGVSSLVYLAWFAAQALAAHNPPVATIALLDVFYNRAASANDPAIPI